jgi:hypothetical protein
MTVKELIDKLSEYDDSCKVLVGNFAVDSDCEFMLSEVLDTDNWTEDLVVLHFYEDCYLREECIFKDDDEDDNNMGICLN